MHPISGKEITEKAILMVPLFLAFIWMGFLVMGIQSPESGMKFAPSRLDSLVNALFVFIILYAIVLGVVFYKMNKSMKKQVKKKK